MSVFARPVKLICPLKATTAKDIKIRAQENMNSTWKSRKNTLKSKRKILAGLCLQYLGANFRSAL